MKYITYDNRIEIKDLSEFDARQIFESGQIFSYEKLDEYHFICYSKDKKCEVIQNTKTATIYTKDLDYFINFFDLKQNYADFKQKLLNFEELEEPIKFGNGIRILRQDPYEMIISFVISANNNIPRIRNSIKYLREHCGTNMGDYFAFPTLDQLLEKDIQFFKDAGLGYRAEQIYKLLRQLNNVDLDALKTYRTEELMKFLISLCGIGPKVADCVLLFGFNRGDVFPVDTWIVKVFHDKFGDTDDRKKMREILIKKFGDLSGIAQQYLFYHKRSFEV